MLLATWHCITFISFCGLVYSVQAESDKNEENAVEEQQMDNLAEWMSSALENANHQRPQYLDKLRIDDTSKRGDEDKKEAPGFIGVRGKRKNSDEMYEDVFSAKMQQSENYPPGFVAVRGKKQTSSTGKKGNPSRFIHGRPRRAEKKEQKGGVPPGFIAPRGKKHVDIVVPGYIASRGKRQGDTVAPGYIAARGKREDGAPGFIGVRGKKQDPAPGFIGVRGRRDGFVPLSNNYGGVVDERDIPLFLVANKDLYDAMEISQDENNDMEREFDLGIPEIEPKQLSREADINKFAIDCVTGNDYFCRRFVAIKG